MASAWWIVLRSPPDFSWNDQGLDSRKRRKSSLMQIILELIELQSVASS